MDIELQPANQESDSLSDQSTDIFNRLDMEPDEIKFSKRIRKAILTFLAQYYLKIITVMAVLIILLICGIIISINQSRNFPTAESEEARFTIQQHKTTTEASGVNDSKSPSPTPSTTFVTMGRKEDYNVNNKAVSVPSGVNKTEEITFTFGNKGEETNSTVENVPCRKFKCGKIPNPCILSNIDYINVKQYSCCGCLNSYRLIRYQEFPMAQTRSMILAGSSEDPCMMSPLDLQVLEHPQNLEGEWDIDRETESLCYLKFDITGLGQRQLIESPESSVDTTLEH